MQTVNSKAKEITTVAEEIHGDQKVSAMAVDIFGLTGAQMQCQTQPYPGARHKNHRTMKARLI